MFYDSEIKFLKASLDIRFNTGSHATPASTITAKTTYNDDDNNNSTSTSLSNNESPRNKKR